MSLLVKNANAVPQSISTQAGITRNLVPAHAPAAVVDGVAPVGPMAPLPVINEAGSATIVTGGVAQTLFAGIVPVNGYPVANNSSANLDTCDVGTATAVGASVAIAPGAVFMTPSGYRPAGVASLGGGATGQAFAVRRW